MDIATILGLLGSFGLIISAIGLDQMGAFIDIPSVNIVFAGSLAALFYKRLERVTEGNGETGTVKDLPVFLF